MNSTKPQLQSSWVWLHGSFSCLVSAMSHLRGQIKFKDNCQFSNILFTTGSYDSRNLVFFISLSHDFSHFVTSFALQWYFTFDPSTRSNTYLMILPWCIFSETSSKAKRNE